MRVLVAQINPTIGDFKENTSKILESFAIARKQKADLVLFPELAITGYPPEDFLLIPDFINESYRQLEIIIAECYDLTAIVGMPTRNEDEGEKHLYNSAAIIENGKLIGFQHKTLLPTYDVFDERRYFEPAMNPAKLWNLCCTCIVYKGSGTGASKAKS
jgi:NAD+ synthase (glutamine-hydrolysing)